MNEDEELSDAELKFIKIVNKTKKLSDLSKKDKEALKLRESLTEHFLSYVNKAFENKKLDLERISRSDFVCVLLDLILYENTALVSNAFKLLIRFF